MAALPPPAPPDRHSASASPSPSIPYLDGQPQARPATTASELGFDGREAHHGTDGVGRAVDQEIDGTDGGGDPKMCTDAGGGKRTLQCKNSQGNQRKKPNDSPLIPTVIKESQSRKRKSANPGLRSPTQVTSSPGVNFLVKSAAMKKEAVKKEVDLGPKFVYKHLGSMATVGRHKALVDLRQSKDSKGVSIAGFASWFIWQIM